MTDNREHREDPGEILGVSLEAGDEEVRAAYLRKVKEHPPDRSPREFERIRDAYDLLREDGTQTLRSRHLRRLHEILVELLTSDPEQEWWPGSSLALAE